jgi:Fe-S cluster assembly scaffold protein SufB
MNNLIQVSIDKSYKIPLLFSGLIRDKVNKTSLSIKLVLQPGVSVEIIDDTVCFEDLSQLYKVYHEIEFVLSDNSRLYYSCVLKPNVDQTDIATEGNNLNFGKKLVFNLLGAKSYAKVRVRCFANNANNFKFKTLQNHDGEGSFSCLCIKNVLCDNAKVECENRIKVSQKGCNVLANQVNRNLIIGSGAHVISVPQLEIENDEVKCRHGAITRTVDDEQLFYMQSRGLDSISAKQLLIKGFLG